MIISSLIVEYKGQKSSKITITKDNAVRIKIQKDLNEPQSERLIAMLTAVAESVIDSHINFGGTLRGKYVLPEDHELEPKILYLATNNKNTRDTYRVYLDTFEIVYTGKHKASCVLIEYKGQYLTVSRKDNPNDIGLPGGSYNSELDCDFVGTVLRETEEETGQQVAIVTNVEPFIKDNCITWYGRIISEDVVYDFSKKNEDETGIVGYNPQEVLENHTTSSFWKYNREMFKHFTDLGIIKNV